MPTCGCCCFFWVIFFCCFDLTMSPPRPKSKSQKFLGDVGPRAGGITRAISVEPSGEKVMGWVVTQEVRAHGLKEFYFGPKIGMFGNICFMR